MDRQTTPPRQVTSPTRGLPPPCKQACMGFEPITSVIPVQQYRKGHGFKSCTGLKKNFFVRSYFQLLVVVVFLAVRIS